MKLQKILVCALLCLSMTGCNIFFRKPAPADSDPQTGTAAPEVTDAPTEEETDGDRRKYPLQTRTVENVTFSVPAYLKHAPRDGREGTYMDYELQEGYQLQGVSPLGSYTPDEFFTELTNGYRENYAIERMDGEMSPFTTADGLEGYVGHVDAISSSTFFSIDVLAVPRKNVVVTFCGQCREGQTLSLDVREITETATFSIALEDVITGNRFSMDDNSCLELTEDGGFIWYEDADRLSDTYAAGTCEVIRGQAAVDRAAYMEEYGLTYEELNRVIQSAMNGYVPGAGNPLDMFREDPQHETYHICLDSFYAVILHSTQLSEANSVTEADGITLFVGFYIEDLGIIDMTNCNTAQHSIWHMT